MKPTAEESSSSLQELSDLVPLDSPFYVDQESRSNLPELDDYSSTPKGSPHARVTTIKHTDYEILSDEIVTNLRDKGFDTIIFDFDGTLTKFHTARESAEGISASHDWFADKEILEKILQKGRGAGINFYIASRQRQEVVENILEAHGLKDYFTEIHGSGPSAFEKEYVIDAIAAKEDHQKILYLDDDAEEISSEKITIITGLLSTLSPRENTKKRDINGEAGLTLDKWKQVLTCLETETYSIQY